LERLLVEAGSAVELVAITGEETLMLKDSSLQFLVRGLAGGGEGQIVAGIGLVVVARIHEDAGALAVSGGDFTMIALLFVELETFLRDGQRLVVLPSAAQGIGQIAH